jgi:isoamylase
MTQEQWNTGWMRSLAVMLNGKTLAEVGDMGEPVQDDSFLIMLNSYGECVTYTLPQSPLNRGWKVIMNTNELENPFDERVLDGTLDVAGRSVVLLRELTPQEAGLPDVSEEEIHRVLEAQVNGIKPEAPAEVAVETEQQEEQVPEPAAELEHAEETAEPEVTEPVAAE